MQAQFSDIGVVVIVYFPDEQVLENIKSYASAFSAVLVIDNSPNASPALQSFAGEHYWHNGVNEGIAKRLNEACRWAQAMGFRWLMTMDQDSTFTSSNLYAYKATFKQLEYPEKVAMAGIMYSADPKEPMAVPAIKKDAVLITSGSLVNIDLFEQVGPFNEAYFIDEVDSEYCLRARAKGYEVVIVEGVYLYHHLGEVNQFISLKSLKATPRSLHSPVRIYYMIRNYCDLKSKYKALFPKHFAQQDSSLRNRIKNNLLYNTKRWQVFRMMWKAYADYKAQRMGKLA